MQYYISLFNENINQFTSLINYQNKINNDLAENHLNKIENFMNKKEKIFNDMVNNIILKMSQNLILRNSGNLSNNNNGLNEKNYKDKIIWLEKQTEELIPFKQKCLLLNEQINKLQSENDFLKNKIDNMKKMFEEKEEVYKLKFQNIKGIIMESFDKFIMQNLPNKYDEFKLIIKNITIDN